jgi:hypothetical protein
MDERGANIDLVFRNGLKDYEVLPPPEVWNSIHPAIKTKQRQIVFLRIAAMIAILITLSFVVYRWSGLISGGNDSIDVAFNMESNSPVFLPPVNNHLALASTEASPVTASQKSPAINVEEINTPAEKEIVSPLYITGHNELTSLSVDKPSYQNMPLQKRGSHTQNRSLEIATINPVYYPETINTAKTERWSIAAMASPTYYSKFNVGADPLSQEMSASEQPRISYSGGVALSYKINRRFTIRTGLYYASLDQQVDGINSFGGFQQYNYTKGDHSFEILTTSGSVYASNPDVYLIGNAPGDRIISAYGTDVFDPKKASLQYLNDNIVQNFSYLELPVVLKYKIIDKALKFSMIGGVSYDLLVNNSVYAKVNGSKYTVGKTEGLNLLTLSSSLGVGMEYGLSSKLSLNLEPTFRYYLNPFNDVTGSKNHPYSFGIFSGISYKF